MEENEVIPFMPEADRTWIKSLAPEDRLGGLAVIAYKKQLPGRLDKVSRLQLFIEAFNCGRDAQADMLTKVALESARRAQIAKESPDEPA